MDDEPRLPEPTPIARDVPSPVWLLRLGLLLLPILAAILGYYRDFDPAAGVWQLKGDQVFYGYQITRTAETGGRWWKFADDPRLGRPYQSIVAKFPAMMEGVDLLLISALSGRLIDRTYNYHFLIVVILAINGWVAGWLVHRLTGSAFWAVVAIVLITWNEPTYLRITCHMHLFKYCWLLLAVWAFSAYLDAPSTRRGILLGLAVGWVLQGSFYYGYFLVLTLGTWWLGCLIAGTLDRRHVAATAAAALTFVVVAAAVTFPIWTITKGYLLADAFSQHPWKHTWYFSSEPWQWLVPRRSTLASEYIAAIDAKSLDRYFEGWSFPGYTVLAGLAVYVMGRLRGLRFCDRAENQRFLDRVMGQIALLLGLSLTGGPSFFLHQFVPSIRCYGRAGLMGLVGLGCVAAPVCLHGMTGWCRFRLTRGMIVAAAVALVAYDSSNLLTRCSWPERTADTTPAWVDWLAKQPPEVKLAAFGPTGLDYWYGTLDYALKHGHTTLNGCDFDLLNGDLHLLGASYYRMNREGFRFIASLGYETLAIHRDFLGEHPWIGSLAWLDRQETVGDWLIFRTNAQFDRIPAIAPGELLLTREGSKAERAKVPPQSWITGQLDLDRTVVVTQPTAFSIAWADAGGRLVSKPCRGLYQHVFGPDLPAYTIKTPNKDGTYELVFLDEQRRRLGSKPFIVTSKLVTGKNLFRRRANDFTVSALAVRGEKSHGDRVRVTMENRTGSYIQAHTLREKELGSAATQPGMSMPKAGSLVMEINYLGGEPKTEQVQLVLPHDLPPHGRLTMDLPVDWRGAWDPEALLLIFPKLIDVGPKVAAEHQGDVALSLEAGARPPQTATSRVSSSAR